MAAGPDAYGQTWRLEAAARVNVAFPASSVYISDLEVFAFHLYNGTVLHPMQYDVSVDGGETFPVMRATAAPNMNDMLGSSLLTLADGTRRILLLLNGTPSFGYSDTVFSLPTSSTWTLVQPPNSLGTVNSIGVRGLNVVAVRQDGRS